MSQKLITVEIFTFQPIIRFFTLDACSVGGLNTTPRAHIRSYLLISVTDERISLLFHSRFNDYVAFEENRGFLQQKGKIWPKKVRRHLEWSHINSKMCSVISEGNRTRIQPVIKLFRHFAHFVTR